MDLPYFKWDTLEPVVIEFLEQIPVNNLQEVPWNYKKPTLLIKNKESSKEGMSTITKSGRIVGDPQLFQTTYNLLTKFKVDS